MNSSFKIVIVAAAVFFGMMLLNKPKEKEAQEAKTNEVAVQESAQASMTDAELALIPSIVREIGVRDTTGGRESFSYRTDAVALNVADGHLDGTVSVDSFTVAVDSALVRHFPVEMNVTQQDMAYNTLVKELKEIGVYRKFASLRKPVPSADTVRLENDVLAIEFDAHGGIMSKATLKKYKTYFASKTDKTRSTRRRSRCSARLTARPIGSKSTNNNNYVDTHHLYFTPRQVNDSIVEMTVDLGDGARWGYRYTLPQGESYLVRMDVIQHNTQNVLPQNTTQMGMAWKMELPRLERGLTFEERNSGIYYRYFGETPDNINGNSSKTEKINHRVQWIAFKDQFFSTIMLPRKGFESGVVQQQAYKVHPDAEHIKFLAADMVVPYSATDEIAASFDVFIGPNLYPLLKDIDAPVQALTTVSASRV